jgi:hypothetical protein
MAMGNNPISSIDPDGGSSCGGEGEPPCELPSFSITASLNKMKQNVMDTFIGWGDVLSRTFNWGIGTEPIYKREVHNNFANAFKDASGVEKGRSYFYDQLNKGRNLFDNPVTNFDTEFGLKGLIDAGIDPYEQFIGTYKITEMVLVKSGKDTYEIHYTLHNVTHFKSAVYHIPLAPSWERFTPGAPIGLSNIRQDMIFSEALENNRLNKGVLRYINHNLNGITR